LAFIDSYNAHVTERSAEGIAPKPLDASQVSALLADLKTAPTPELVDLLTHRVPPGVDEAAYVKAGYLAAVAAGSEPASGIDRARAIELLGTMQGGYNVAPLVSALSDPDAELAALAAQQLKMTLLVFDAFYDVEELATGGNAHAKSVMESWASAEWFLSRPPVADKMTVTVFKVSGETNTDDLSPAPDAWSRPDIPLHALAMLKMERDGIQPDAD
ncbi:hypothetical protein TeGR_g2289, partial [Tetraparma gracilis]